MRAPCFAVPRRRRPPPRQLQQPRCDRDDPRAPLPRPTKLLSLVVLLLALAAAPAAAELAIAPALAGQDLAWVAGQNSTQLTFTVGNSSCTGNSTGDGGNNSATAPPCTYGWVLSGCPGGAAPVVASNTTAMTLTIGYGAYRSEDGGGGAALDVDLEKNVGASPFKCALTLTEFDPNGTYIANATRDVVIRCGSISLCAVSYFSPFCAARSCNCCALLALRRHGDYSQTNAYDHTTTQPRRPSHSPNSIPSASTAVATPANQTLSLVGSAGPAVATVRSGRSFCLGGGCSAEWSFTCDDASGAGAYSGSAVGNGSFALNVSAAGRAIVSCEVVLTLRGGGGNASASSAATARVAVVARPPPTARVNPPPPAEVNVTLGSSGAAAAAELLLSSDGSACESSPENCTRAWTVACSGGGGSGGGAVVVNAVVTNNTRVGLTVGPGPGANITFNATSPAESLTCNVTLVVTDAFGQQSAAAPSAVVIRAQQQQQQSTPLPTAVIEIARTAVDLSAGSAGGHADVEANSLNSTCPAAAAPCVHRWTVQCPPPVSTNLAIDNSFSFTLNIGPNRGLGLHPINTARATAAFVCNVSLVVTDNLNRTGQAAVNITIT